MPILYSARGEHLIEVPMTTYRHLIEPSSHRYLPLCRRPCWNVLSAPTPTPTLLRPKDDGGYFAIEGTILPWSMSFVCRLTSPNTSLVLSSIGTRRWGCIEIMHDDGAKKKGKAKRGVLSLGFSLLCRARARVLVHDVGVTKTAAAAINRSVS